MTTECGARRVGQSSFLSWRSRGAAAAAMASQNDAAAGRDAARVQRPGRKGHPGRVDRTAYGRRRRHRSVGRRRLGLGARAIPEYCLVTDKISPVDTTAPDIQFRVALPTV